MSRTRTRRRRSGRRPGAVKREWVGGRLSPPFYVTEGEPYRPEMVVWLELPDDLVVGNALAAPGKEVSLGQTLIEAMRRPAVGPPRRPARIRVANARQAEEVRAAVPGIDVRVAPTPELDKIVQLMAEHMAATGAGDDAPNYLEGGRISPEVVEPMFRASEALYRLAPWKTLDDGQVLRMDIPALDVRGACVSVIGALGESLGVIVFPSIDGYERFLDAAERSERGASLDLGTTMLSLCFERGAELPDVARKQVASHGWPVASTDAFPWLEHRDRDGLPRPLTERDVRIATACATAFGAFFAKHRAVLARGDERPLRESYIDDRDLDVRITYPYHASDQFAVVDPPSTGESTARKVGRNEPCPCGSGAKYKKCCLTRDSAADGADGVDAVAPVHQLDARLVQAMQRFASRRFGDDWWARAAEDFAHYEDTMLLFSPWAIYCCAVDGKPIVDWYRDERRSLPAEQRAWLDAQQRAWLSAWEVLAVDPGRSITLLDVLSGEQRTVREASASCSVAARDVLLARVVDVDGTSVLAGIHPRTLPPIPAAEVVQRLRGRLRRKRAVPVDRLRDEKFGRYAIARWEDAVLDLDLRRSVPPKLHNTDGDELLWTVDHFEIADGGHRDIERRLAALPDVEPPEPDDAERAFTVCRDNNEMHGGLDNTLIGRIIVEPGALRIETNSIARADALRTRIEAVCGDRLRHRVREHSDPIAQLAHGPPGDSPDEEPPPAEVDAMLRQVKERHYADWVDQPLPALNGKTPRQAVGTKAGREQVDLLLKDCENHEARTPPAQRFDFAILRRQLEL